MDTTIPSPCINVCSLDRRGICVGCNRTKQEITDWIKATDSEKQAILNRISRSELELNVILDLV